MEIPKSVMKRPWQVPDARELAEKAVELVRMYDNDDELAPIISVFGVELPLTKAFQESDGAAETVDRLRREFVKWLESRT